MNYVELYEKSIYLHKLRNHIIIVWKLFKFYLISFKRLVQCLQLMNAQWNQKFSVTTYNFILSKDQVADVTSGDRERSSTCYRRAILFLCEIAIATFAQCESISTHWFRDASLHFRYCHRSPLTALWRVLFSSLSAHGQIKSITQRKDGSLAKIKTEI